MRRLDQAPEFVHGDERDVIATPAVDDDGLA
jgi:hypothetical protein